MRTGILLVTHGTVESLDDLPAFVTNIRRGHPPPPSLLAELERRYRAIGGASPLNRISRELAENVEKRTGFLTRAASRLWHPYPNEVLSEMQSEGVTQLLVIPLAQYSTHVYREGVDKAVKELASEARPIEVRYASNWGSHPLLVEAFKEAIAALLGILEHVEVFFTAHSLPLAVLRAGDPYENEVRASAAAIAQLLSLSSHSVSYGVTFQSQGATTGADGKPLPWLGPDLHAAIRDAHARGVKELVIAPIGFLADHVEILFDLDIEAKGWADELGLRFVRTPSLNASEPLVSVIAAIAGEMLMSELKS